MKYASLQIQKVRDEEGKPEKGELYWRVIHEGVSVASGDFSFSDDSLWPDAYQAVMEHGVNRAQEKGYTLSAIQIMFGWDGMD